MAIENKPLTQSKFCTQQKWLLISRSKSGNLYSCAPRLKNKILFHFGLLLFWFYIIAYFSNSVNRLVRPIVDFRDLLYGMFLSNVDCDIWSFRECLVAFAAGEGQYVDLGPMSLFVDLEISRSGKTWLASMAQNHFVVKLPKKGEEKYYWKCLNMWQIYR